MGKVFWLLSFVIGFGLYGISQTNVYIDLDAAIDGSGSSPSDPRNTMAAVDNAGVSNVVYWVRAGTSEQYASSIDIYGVHDVTVRRYDLHNGGFPIIYSDNGAGVFKIKNSQNITIQGMAAFGNGRNGGAILAFIEATSGGYCENIVIDSCNFSYGYQNIRGFVYEGAIGIKDVYIRNCNLRYVGLDNVYFDGRSDATIQKVVMENCYIGPGNYIWYVNRDENVSAGDNFHGIWVDTIIIRNCTFDHKETSNKFNFIATLSPDAYYDIQHCTFYPPKDTINPLSSAGAAFHDYSSPNKVVFQYNYVTGRGTRRWGGTGRTPAAYFTADTVVMNYNIFDSTGKTTVADAYIIDHIEAYNNTWLLPIDTAGGWQSYAISLQNAATGNFKNNLIVGAEGYTLYNPYNSGTGLSKSNNYELVESPSNWATLLGMPNWMMGNFSLVSSSPLIDAGTSTYPGLTTDFEGNSIPAGLAMDIGAIEYQPELNSPEAPIAVQPNRITETAFRAVWVEAANVDYYEIDVSTDPVFSTFLPGYQSKEIHRAYEYVTGLNSNNAYYYRVRAVNSYGSSGNSNTITVNTQQVRLKTVRKNWAKNGFLWKDSDGDGLADGWSKYSRESLPDVIPSIVNGAQRMTLNSAITAYYRFNLQQSKLDGNLQLPGENWAIDGDSTFWVVSFKYRTNLSGNFQIRMGNYNSEAYYQFSCIGDEKWHYETSPVLWFNYSIASISGLSFIHRSGYNVPGTWFEIDGVVLRRVTRDGKEIFDKNIVTNPKNNYLSFNSDSATTTDRARLHYPGKVDEVGQMHYGTRTICTWFRTDVHNVSNMVYIHNSAGAGGNGYGVRVGRNADNRIYTFSEIKGEDGVRRYVSNYTNLGIIPDEEWIFVTVSFGRDSIIPYINAQKANVTTFSDPGNVTSAPGYDFTIGKPYSLERYIQADVDDVAVFDRELTQSEVLYLYNGGYENRRWRLPYLKPILYFPFDDGTGREVMTGEVPEIIDEGSHINFISRDLIINK